MTRYRVLIHPEAEKELENAYRHIAAEAPERALRWRQQLVKKAHSLATLPERCAKAPEAASLGEDLRHLIVGNYRIIFVIEPAVVTVLHIRHGAMRPVGTPLPEE